MGLSKKHAKKVGYIFYKNKETCDRQDMADELDVHTESSVLRKLRKVKNEFPEIIDPNDYEKWVKRTGKGGDLYKSVDADTQVRIQRLQNQIEYWRGQYNKSIDRQAKIENFYDTMKRVVSTLPPVDTNELEHEPVSNGKESAVALFSDLHAGESISPEETDGMGFYNIDIAARRLEIWAERIVEIVNLHRKNYPIEKLFILDLGDKTSGLIHEELTRTADVPAGQQFAVVAYLIAQVYMMLAREFEEIHVHSVYGNHGRLGKAKNHKEGWVNFDYFASQLTALFCKDQDNISFHTYRAGKKRIDVGGWTAVIQHGDGIRSYNGIPFYGITRSAKRQLAQQTYLRNLEDRIKGFESEALEDMGDVETEDIDFVAMGHFHQGGTLERAWGTIFLNGCFPGPSEYSLKKDIVSRPSQWLFGLHPNRLSWRYMIHLDDDSKSPFEPLYLNKSMPEDWGSAFEAFELDKIVL